MLQRALHQINSGTSSSTIGTTTYLKRKRRLKRYRSRGPFAIALLSRGERYLASTFRSPTTWIAMLCAPMRMSKVVQMVSRTHRTPPNRVTRVATHGSVAANGVPSLTFPLIMLRLNCTKARMKKTKRARNLAAEVRKMTLSGTDRLCKMRLQNGVWKRPS